jgi:hypothetical protein
VPALEEAADQAAGHIAAANKADGFVH